MKYIENYSVVKYNNDIICLSINTTDKWLAYHRYNDNRYVIGEDLDDDTLCEELHIESEFIPIEKGKVYVCASSQEKDQIKFYWIPFTRGTLISREYIIEKNN